MKTKKELIDEAWEDFWKGKLNNHIREWRKKIDEDGWFESDSLWLGFPDVEIKRVGLSRYYRPMSLRGIEDNNGWRSISSIKEEEKQQSFNSLPKTNDYYDIIVNGEVEYRYYYSGCISSDGWVKRNVTHFRLSETHKLPFF